MYVLAINGSPRKDGATAAVLRSAAEMLEGRGITIETVDLGGLGISDCRGCMACKRTSECVIDDDMRPLYAKIRDSDMIVFASPVYFGGVTGIFKSFLDRMYAMVSVRDGTRVVDMGNPKRGSVVLTCGAPDGDMLYQGISIQLMGVMRSLGITDVSSAVIPCRDAGDVTASDRFREYMDALDFQLM